LHELNVILTHQKNKKKQVSSYYNILILNRMVTFQSKTNGNKNLPIPDLYRMTGDHVREQEGVTMHTNFSQMLLKEHLSASQLLGNASFKFRVNWVFWLRQIMSCFWQIFWSVFPRNLEIGNDVSYKIIVRYPQRGILRSF